MISGQSPQLGVLRRSQRGYLLDPYRYGSGGGGSGGTYHSANLVMMFDAGVTASYPGSGQLFQNLVASPADGSAQTDYDFHLGDTSAAEGSDPTFVGTAGTDVSYFSCGESPAANKYFTKAAANSAFLNGLHKAGAQYTIEVWLLPNARLTGIRPAFDSGGSDQGGSYTSGSVSFADMSGVGAEKNMLYVTRDTAGARSLQIIADNALTPTTINMLACSIDATGATNSFLYRNGAYDQVGAVDTWNGTYATPGTANPVNKAALMARADLLTNLQGRLYLLRVYNTNLTKAQLDTNWTGNRSRFGL